MAVKGNKIKFNISSNKTTAKAATDNAIYFANEYADGAIGSDRGIYVNGKSFTSLDIDKATDVTYLVGPSNDEVTEVDSLYLSNKLYYITSLTDSKTSTTTTETLHVTGTVDATGNIKAGGDISATNGTISGKTLSASGNISATNGTISGKTISATGTISGNTLTGELSGSIASDTTATTQASSNSSTKIATTAFVHGAITDRLANYSQVLVYRGTIGTNGTITSLDSVSASAKSGDTYRVITAGTYNGETCEIGDMIICISSGSSTTDATWSIIQNNIDLTGYIAFDNTSAKPAANYLPLFSDTSGTKIKNGGNIEALNPTASFGKSVTLGNVGDSNVFKFTMPDNPHIEGKNVVGSASSTSDNSTSTITNGNLYLNHVEYSTIKSSHLITGVSGIQVTKDASNTSIKISHTNSITAATIGETKATSGYSISIPYITYDSQGHITKTGTRTHTVSDNNTIPAAYCSTAAGTAAKTASHTGYKLTSNTYELVTIVNANTSQSALTLSINSQTAKPIYIDGDPSSTSNYTLPAGTYLVYYDGTGYQFRTDGVLPGTILNATNATKIKVTGSANNLSLSPYFVLGTTETPSTDGKYVNVTSYVGTIGSNIKPIYINAGVYQAVEKDYAGGTNVTLNGGNLGGNSASFYAPISGGTSGYILKSNGSGSAPTWTAQTDYTLYWE